MKINKTGRFAKIETAIMIPQIISNMLAKSARIAKIIPFNIK